MSGATDAEHGERIAAVAATRAAMWADGYPPVALYSWDCQHEWVAASVRGKRPKRDAWQDRARLDPPEAAHAPPEPDALETGILCDGLRALDLDIDGADAAGAVRALAVRRLGETMTRFRDNSSRVLMLYRAAEGSPGKRTRRGSLGTIEVLGHGQQFTAHGWHNTGAALQWTAYTPRVDLPAITEAQLDAFLADAAPLIGWEPEKRRKEGPPAASSPAPVPERQPSPSGERAPATEREKTYVAMAVANEVRALARVPSGRNDALNKAAFALGTMVGAGWIDRHAAETLLTGACVANGYWAKHPNQSILTNTLRSGLDSGIAKPRGSVPVIALPILPSVLALGAKWRAEWEAANVTPLPAAVPPAGDARQ